MKDHVEIGHWPSTMLLRWTETKLWALKYGSKSIQMSLILRQHPPNSYKLKINICMISMILFKMGKHSNFDLSFFQLLGAWQHFTVVTKLVKNFKSLIYGFGGRCLEIRDICLDFEPFFKVHNLASVHPKSIILQVKWPISTWSFTLRCQFIDWLKLETCPSSLWISEWPI